MPNIETLSH